MDAQQADKIREAEELAAKAAAAKKEQPSYELGVTQEYNQANRSSYWDSAKDKREYKDEVFANQQTYDDPVSGKSLHYSQKAAQKKYHMKNKDGENISAAWAGHTAETDHVVSLKTLHERTKMNPFFTDEDLKAVANKKHNYRILSKQMNTSKGDKSDLAVILDRSNGLSRKGRGILLKRKIAAEVGVNGEIAVRTAKNMSREFAVGAKCSLEDRVMPLLAEGVRQMCSMASGECDAGEAAQQMGKYAVKTAVVGGTKRLISDVGQFAAQNTKLPLGWINQSEFRQIALIASLVKDSALRYVGGEIDEAGFAAEIGEKGSLMVASMIGAQAGSEIGGIIGGTLGTLALPGIGTAAGVGAGWLAGQVIGAAITMTACTLIMTVRDTARHMDDYQLKESQIKHIESEALAEMKRQREYVQEIIEREYGCWDQRIEEGFYTILVNACEESFDVEGIAEGLDKILGIFGKEVAFKTFDEYEMQLDNTLVISLGRK